MRNEIKEIQPEQIEKRQNKEKELAELKKFTGSNCV